MKNEIIKNETYKKQTYKEWTLKKNWSASIYRYILTVRMNLEKKELLRKYLPVRINGTVLVLLWESGSAILHNVHMTVFCKSSVTAVPVLEVFFLASQVSRPWDDRVPQFAYPRNGKYRKTRQTINSLNWVCTLKGSTIKNWPISAVALKNNPPLFTSQQFTDPWHWSLFPSGVVDPNTIHWDPDPEICHRLDPDPNPSRFTW